MTIDWEHYSRFGLNVASTATSMGFTAAKLGTKIGFRIARGVTSTVAGIAGYPLGVGPVLGVAVATVFTLAEHVVLAPILIGETITSTSFVAAESSIDILSTMFPGSDEASFSLAAFVTLVKREWNEPALWEQLPEERYSVTEIAKALIAWATLQGVTDDWKEKEWFKVLREIKIDEPEDRLTSRKRTQSRITITEDTIYPRDEGQVISADFGETPAPSETSDSLDNLLYTHSNNSYSKLKTNLRRLSKMVLAGYGGAGLIFFGVSLTPPPPPSFTSNPERDNAQTTEEHILADAVDASENLESSSSGPVPNPIPKFRSYSWWNVLLGRHDQDIFEGYAFTPATIRESSNARRRKGKQKEKPSTVIIGAENRMPRFWVLTDHGRHQVVLVFRGTMSLNELAVDLTCDPAPFMPANSISEPDLHPMPMGPSEDKRTMPGSLHFPSMERTSSNQGWSSQYEQDVNEVYTVHGGMLRMAEVMGAKGKPVHQAVKEALLKNSGYELILCGHSLGAGVAALLALTWADPTTCLTVPPSGLPAGRRVSVYCFAPPCLVEPALSVLSQDLITSFVYSLDVVSRLSLGSVRDMNRAAAWLCEANKLSTSGSGEEGYSAVTKRALKWRAGYGDPEDPEWFLSIRKTLEANMHMADLFPPGRVLWAVNDSSLHAIHRNPSNPLAGDSSGTSTDDDTIRLFEVLDVEKVFGQIIFARDMLSSHLPHQYDRVLHELR